MAAGLHTVPTPAKAATVFRPACRRAVSAYAALTCPHEKLRDPCAVGILWGVKRLLIVLCALGCAETPPRVEGPAPAELAAAPPAPATVRPLDQAPPGKLFREDVDAIVDAGLGQFLQHVSVDAQLRDGKFTGWIVRGLYPPDYWSGVDLMPGDVITQINGKSIERDTEAFAVFQSLKMAPKLTVSALRAGAPHPLSYDIVPRPALASP